MADVERDPEVQEVWEGYRTFARAFAFLTESEPEPTLAILELARQVRMLTEEVSAIGRILNDAEFGPFLNYIGVQIAKQNGGSL